MFRAILRYSLVSFIGLLGILPASLAFAEVLPSHRSFGIEKPPEETDVDVCKEKGSCEGATIIIYEASKPNSGEDTTPDEDIVIIEE